MQVNRSAAGRPATQIAGYTWSTGATRFLSAPLYVDPTLN
jgi:hypothetical protein